MTTYLDSSVIFSIVFKKGEADKHRLPLAHVISTLQYIEQIVRDVGRQIQRDAGVENPDGDFGIELLAGRSGIAFRKGSLATQATVTRNIQYGVQAIATLIDTTEVIERNQPKKQPVFVSEYSDRIIRRLPKISEIQEQDNTELHLTLAQNNHVLKSTKLGARGRETLRRMESPEGTVEGITVYGKLRALKDLSRGETNESGHFWGELLEDNGHKWHIRFEDSDLKKVLSLFTKQVSIAGDVTYFKTRPPRLDAKDIDADSMPDYTAVFDELSEAYADVFKDKEPEDILKDIRE